VVAETALDDTAACCGFSWRGVTVDQIYQNWKRLRVGLGVTHLASTPPDIVIMIDADCSVTTGTIDRLGSVCGTGARDRCSPLLMTVRRTENQIIRSRICLARQNWVRPVGARALGLPCQLMGSGMAFSLEDHSIGQLSAGCRRGLKTRPRPRRIGHARAHRRENQFPTASAANRRVYSGEVEAEFQVLYGGEARPAWKARRSNDLPGKSMPLPMSCIGSPSRASPQRSHPILTRQANSAT